MQKRILLSLFVSSCFLAGAKDDDVVLDPFSEADSKGEYQPIDWPNIDFPVFVLAIGGFRVEREEWPETVDQVGDGFSLWAASSGASEEDKKKVKEKIDLPKTFQIVERILMRRGVAYRVIYTKRGITVPGLIVLRDAESAEEIVKQAWYSEDLAKIVYAVPF